MHPRRAVIHAAAAIVLLVGVGDAAPVAAASELQARTARAYDDYFERARREFVDRAPAPRTTATDGDDVSAGPASEDGIIRVPGGLVHHWRGRAFVPGRTLTEVVAVSRAYPDYPSVYKAVIAATLLDEDDGQVRVQIRMKESAGGLSAVLQVRSTVLYSHPAPGTALVLSVADEIREVKNAGDRDEHLLPAGNDSGYLWRASTFTRLVEVPGGVRVEMETLGLSRGFPPLLGWIIEPIARRLGRKSVEATLREFVAACVERPS